MQRTNTPTRSQIQKSTALRRRALGAILPILLIICWEIAAVLINNEFILPRLESVLAVLASPTTDILGSGSLINNALLSVERVAMGFGLAAAVGIPLGMVMGYWQKAEDFVDTTVQLFRPIPPLAWIPLALAWFKTGLISMTFIIFIGAVFPVLLNTVDGVKSVNRTWVESALTFGANQRQVLAKVVMPASLPTIWTGLRVGFGIAWMCVVAAEMLPGTTSGLGYLIMYAYNWGQVQVIIAGMIVIGLIGLLIDGLFRVVEHRKFTWRGMTR
ncbi:ABC transporter permease [Methanofollis aquaemaris]|uniref:ABC transporter permease n=1 Tax=Methanofollis aquaemaris TaxID=126734 RepID=A0A8A3S856_9EURY|nr:ABC transporter permease [Methanofollis aquaemaris]QSZ68113.1 ABC transporter permease [Methanofollis aquaemaris]